MSQYRIVQQPISNEQLQERAQANARMAAVASALQGKYALVRAQDSLALIYILSTDCLLNPGAKRLTAFDIHLTAVVYGPTARAGTFAITNTYRTFIAYDLVALFSAPGPAAAVAAAASSVQQVITPPPHWINAFNTLERRAAEPGMGGHEALPSIFADDTAMNALVRASAHMQMLPSTAAPSFRPACPSRRDSLAVIHGGMGRRLSSH